MIRRHSYVFRLILMAADVVMALAIVTIAARLRFGSGSVDGIEVPALPSPEFSVGLFVAVWIGLLWSHGLYRSAPAGRSLVSWSTSSRRPDSSSPSP